MSENEQKGNRPMFRHEFKHRINYADYMALKQRIRYVMKKDSNTGQNGTYKIHSLYFDNLDDKALREKMDGVNNREKFRIRYYNFDTSFIRLEKKTKINGLCNKRSTLLSREESEKIVNGEIEWMSTSNDDLLIELYVKMKYQQLKPRCIVDYEREAYVYEAGNVRVTFDSNIRSRLSAKDLFDDSKIGILTQNNDFILEVKYDSFLPEIIANIIQLKNRETSSFSKYAICRMYD